MQIKLDLPDCDSHVPSFEATAKSLKPIIPAFWRAMEFAVAKNQEYFEKLCDKEKPASHIREMIVRHQAKRYFKRLDVRVEEEPDNGFNLINQPLVALNLRLGPVALRVLKGRDGAVPGCGYSVARKRFYGQFPTRHIDANHQIRETKLNLLILWNFDKEFNLDQLRLACPQKGGFRAQDVECYWNEPLPHAAAIQAEPSDTPEPLHGKPLNDTVERDLEDLLRGQDEDQQEESSEAT